MQNAVAVMRVSSDRQGMDGDSIEHQKDQIDLYSSTRNITIKKYFIFIDSASKEQQPVQEAIDYCKNPKNKIDLFIIKSIDRFTRGGSSLYDHMKTELSKHGVKLIDIYGVINHQSINTLEHLEVEYAWSVYSPSKKSELLEAERGKDELRDILSRMIGAEIRYVRMGYRVRQAPFGYQNVKIETPQGKRYILGPHPIESVWIKKIFALKEQGLLTDRAIIEHVNEMGFLTRRRYKRDQNNINKITGIMGRQPLDLKLFDQLIRNPIYASITVEKWTKYKPLKCKFEGLISLETFNKVNQGKIMIFEENGELKLLKGKLLTKRLVATKISMTYSYKRLVLCPISRHFFYGSASRGKRGKVDRYFPAYHCDKSKRGHYYRVPVKKFNQTIEDYLNSVRIKKKFITKIHEALSQNKEVQKDNGYNQFETIKRRLLQIEEYIKLLVDKIKMLHSETALQSIEQELEQFNKEKKELEQKQISLGNHMKRENLVEGAEYSNKIPQQIIQDHTEITKKHLFTLLFVQLPTYEELVNKTTLLNKEFEIK